MVSIELGVQSTPVVDATAVCTKLAILEVVIRLSAHAHISQQIHLARNMAGMSYEPCRTRDVV